MLNDLSFVTTSLNRTNNLILQCEWLKKSGFFGNYVIVDASSECNEELFSAYDFVKYFRLPRVDAVEGAVFGFHKVITSFSTFIGDDDIPMLSGYQKCVKFLQENSHFDSCRAAASYINHEKLMDKEHKSGFKALKFFLRTILSAQYGGAVDISFKEKHRRFQEITSNYVVTQLFVTRSDVNKVIFGRGLAKIGDVHSFEYVTCLAHAFFMRSAQIKGLYLLRGYGNYRPNADMNEKRHAFDHGAAIEAVIMKYCKTISPIEHDFYALYRATIIKRFLAENDRFFANNKKLSTVDWLLSQCYRIRFVMFEQTVERLVFIGWAKKQRF